MIRSIKTRVRKTFSGVWSFALFGVDYARELGKDSKIFLQTFYEDFLTASLNVVDSVRVIFLYITGSLILDYGFWKMLEPWAAYKWVAAILLGMQILHLGSSVEKNNG